MENKRKKILILHFPNLNNYGTAMMGLVLINGLIQKYGNKNIEIYCTMDDEAIQETLQELNQSVSLKKYGTPKAAVNHKKSVFRRFKTLYQLLFRLPHQGFDRIYILGGDDISEYYGKYDAFLSLWSNWKISFTTPIILVGQTIGPFKYAWNKKAIQWFLPRFEVYARDNWTVEYLKNELNTKVHSSVDLAFHDLPRQKEHFREKDILGKYGLDSGNYITIVVSGLVREGYYCKSEKDYLQCHSAVIEQLFEKKEFENIKIVLLAHTFPPYGDEAELINLLVTLLPEKAKKRTVAIKEKILPTNARFILGNGIFTITGRMHPAISTYQMNKPAISLSYSKKYHGVIGKNLGRNDLIIDADLNSLWKDRTIVSMIMEKVNYLTENYSTIISEIKKASQACKEKIDETLHAL